jgi:transposase
MKVINTIRLSACRESRKGMHHEGNFGDLIKVIWHDGHGACLFSKRLERGRFIWPTLAEGAVNDLARAARLHA